MFNLIDHDTATLSLTWEPPFTLDITGVDPDIIYCVDVVNYTSSMTIYTECGITETHFEFLLPNEYWCTRFEFTVIPLNMAGNGSSQSSLYTPVNAGMDMCVLL